MRFGLHPIHHAIVVTVHEADDLHVEVVMAECLAVIADVNVQVLLQVHADASIEERYRHFVDGLLVDNQFFGDGIDRIFVAADKNGL
jgi:hypothetical protein